MQVHVNPALLQWARRRASLSPDALADKMDVTPDKVSEWERSGTLTLGRLESLSQKTYTPVGYLFLPEPPVEGLPVADFRTGTANHQARPSPNLLDTLYQCQRRQDWYREYLITEGAESLPFVGSASLGDSLLKISQSIRQTIGLDIAERAAMPSWEKALTSIIDRVEEAGILVMRNGIVGNNTSRKLDYREFRGFALSDDYAPLIFVNGTDFKVSQMFTLAHELAHIWLGQSGISDVRIRTSNSNERYCNAVAAEILVPETEFRAQWKPGNDLLVEVRRLARFFKVSSLVIFIRAFQAGIVSDDEFESFYSAAIARDRPDGGEGGGDFYKVQRFRLGSLFARALLSSTLEGRTTYSEAFTLLGINKSDTFEKLARHWQVIR